MVTIVYIIEEEGEGVQAVFSSEALAGAHLISQGWTEESKGMYSGHWSKTSTYSQKVSRSWIQPMVVDEEVV